MPSFYTSEEREKFMNNYMRKQGDDVAGAIVIIVAALALLNLFLL